MDSNEELYKSGSLQDGVWASFSYPRVFTRASTSGPDRLHIYIPALTLEPILALLELMPEPLLILYVLHTPRGAEPGRYESPELTYQQVLEFFEEFGEFFMRDARHNIWIFSPSSEITLVWDRHDVLYAYGHLELLSSKLETIGYVMKDCDVPIPHSHHYHKEFDGQQNALLEKYDWIKSEVESEDLL